jgi:RNA polymerase sigma-70 factor (ECF subfamily)
MVARWPPFSTPFYIEHRIRFFATHNFRAMTLSIEQQLEQFSTYLRGFAFKLTKDVEDANDLYQDTMLKILANQDKFHIGTNFRAWSSTIMRNVFINAYRKRKITNTIFDSTDNTFYIDSGAHAVLNKGESNLSMNELMGAVGELKEDLSTPFMMSYYGYKYDEIAEALQLPLGTVKSRIFFARKELQDRVGKMFRVRDNAEKN